MKSVLVIALVILSCAGCAVAPASYSGHNTAANSTASYDYKGDITRDGGTDCWYYCP